MWYHQAHVMAPLTKLTKVEDSKIEDFKAKCSTNLASKILRLTFLVAVLVGVRDQTQVWRL
jgi:hypothetical protein